LPVLLQGAVAGRLRSGAWLLVAVQGAAARCCCGVLLCRCKVLLSKYRALL